MSQDGDDKVQLTRRDRQREETRERVFQAALEVFRRDGVDSCRIDDIATLAQVSRGSFYFHFPTKDDVLLELMRITEGDVCDRLSNVPDDVAIVDFLEHVSVAFSDIWEGDPTLLPEVAGVALKRVSAQITDREISPLRFALSKRFTLCGARGELAPFLPPETMADLYLANCLAGMLAWCAAPELTLHAVLSGVGIIFLHGAAPRDTDEVL